MSQQKFLSRVAEKVLTLNPLETVVVLPNRRAGLFLKKHISTKILKPYFLPTILTIEELFLTISNLTKIEQVEQLMRLYESYKSTYSHKENIDSFDTFLSWAPTFLSDCNEIDTNLIDIDTFFDTLYNDREIRNWNMGEEHTELQKEYLAFWETAKNLYTHFTTQLLKDKRAYNGLAYRVAIEQLPERVSTLSYKHYLFVGFNALNQAEEALFNYLHQQNIAEFLWDVDAYYVNDQENKAGKYFRQYKDRWSTQHDLQHPPSFIGSQTEAITIIESPNQVTQCNIAAQIVKDWSAKGHFNANTAIVLGDETLLEPLLYQLPKKLGSYNITMGKSLAQFPLYHLFDDYLRLQQKVVKKNSALGFTVSTLTPLFINSYIQQLDSQNQINQVLEYIIVNNVSILWEEQLFTQLDNNSTLAQLVQPTSHLPDIIEQMNKMVEHLRIIFQARKDRLSIQVLFEIKKILQQLSSFLHLYQAPLSISAFRNLFRQTSRSTRIPYEGEPLQGLQIMGMLETRCLDFDHLIILSTNESVLPKGRSANSFIPFIFKNHFQIQTFKDKDAIYAYSFYRLLHQAKQITYIYDGQEGVMGGGEISRFVKQIEAEFSHKTKRNIPIQKIAASFNNSSDKPQEYTIEKTDEVLTDIRSYLQEVGLSPSSIKVLVNNPLDFYFQYVASIKQPEELEVDIELSTFGTIVHNSLEELYKPYVSQQLTEPILNTLLTQVNTQVNLQIKKEFKEGNVQTGINYLYKQAAEKLVTETIKTDLKRIKSHQLQLISLEDRIETYLPVEIESQHLQIKLRGNVDRLQYRDKAIEIIDYKTGSVNESQLQLKHVSSISKDPNKEKLHQLLCYCLLVSEGSLGLPLEVLRPGMQALKSWEKGISFLNDDEDCMITEEIMDEYKQQLVTILTDLLNPSIPFTPEKEDARLKYSVYASIYT